VAEVVGPLPFHAALARCAPEPTTHALRPHPGRTTPSGRRPSRH
jgi:hypothetical protein